MNRFHYLHRDNDLILPQQVASSQKLNLWCWNNSKDRWYFIPIESNITRRNRKFYLHSCPHAFLLIILYDRDTLFLKQSIDKLFTKNWIPYPRNYPKRHIPLFPFLFHQGIQSFRKYLINLEIYHKYYQKF